MINACCVRAAHSPFRDYAKAELTRRKLPLPEGS